MIVADIDPAGAARTVEEIVNVAGIGLLAAEVLHCLRRPVTAYGQNLVVVPRNEPDFPR